MNDYFERNGFIKYDNPDKKVLINIFSKDTLKNKKYYLDFKTNTIMDIEGTDIKIALASRNKDTNSVIFFINKKHNSFNYSVNSEARTYYIGLTDEYHLNSYIFEFDKLLKIDTTEDYYLDVLIVDANIDTRVSKIFDNPPKQWGFRGDPYFWDYLKDKFSNYNFPFEYEKLEKIIKEEHLKLTGIPLTEDSMGKCKQFEHGGMTSGGISGDFWVNRAFPLLRSRIDKETLS